MSHILHFYHLVALDYVDPYVDLGPLQDPPTVGQFTQLKRPFLCPRYHKNYYITTARILALAPLLPPAAVTRLATLPGVLGDLSNIGDAVNTYLVGQYLRALDIRRLCHEMQAIFSGRAPQCSGWTPGGATSTFTQADIDNYQTKLDTVKAFVGEPLDFKNGIAGTMMFDVVAAAHLFPEYFWIGNSWSNFMAWGWGEEAGTISLTGQLGGILTNMPNPAGDARASARGWKQSAQAGAAWNGVNIMKIGESLAGSRYNKNLDGTYPPFGSGVGWKHPWDGVTKPNPNNEYSWLKSPAYDIGVGDYRRFEVGPLSRMVVAGAYFAGLLHDTLGDGTGTVLYPLAPKWGLLGGDLGPDISTGSGHPLESVYAGIPGVTGGPNLSGVAYNGDSVLDRIAARAIECRLMIDMAQHFLNQLAGSISSGWSSSGSTDPTLPVTTAVKKGYGMSEASRGALSHWIKMKNGKIKLYQAVVPTTWNASPRDINGNPGPAEKSLMSDGGAWIANPLEAIELPRITHSYDFCIACAVHLITPKGEKIRVDIPALP
jgi:Ni,Fe-hydrogenase I large subunit